jgi:hypothetical protein
MAHKRKATLPGPVADGDNVASKKTHKNYTRQPSKRQQFKQIIVWLAVHGVVPISLAEWLIRRGGMS